MASGGPIKSVPESTKNLSRRWRQEFTVCAERTRERHWKDRKLNKEKCILVNLRKNWITMRTLKLWKRVLYLLTPMLTEFIRICV